MFLAADRLMSSNSIRKSDKPCYVEETYVRTGHNVSRETSRPVLELFSEVAAQFGNFSLSPSDT